MNMACLSCKEEWYSRQGCATPDGAARDSSERCTMPLGLTYSTLTRPQGFVPVNYIVGGGYNVVRPDNVGTWFVRFQVNFVLAK